MVWLQLNLTAPLVFCLMTNPYVCDLGSIPTWFVMSSLFGQSVMMQNVPATRASSSFLLLCHRHYLCWKAFVFSKVWTIPWKQSCFVLSCSLTLEYWAPMGPWVHKDQWYQAWSWHCSYSIGLLPDMGGPYPPRKSTTKHFKAKQHRDLTRHINSWGSRPTPVPPLAINGQTCPQLYKDLCLLHQSLHPAGK